MQHGALRALEFDRIVEVLRSCALTPLGAARLAALRPSSEPVEVQAALAATTEAVRYLAQSGQIALRAPQDLPEILAALALDTGALEPRQLLGLAEFLSSVDHVCGTVARAGASSFPILTRLSDRAAAFQAEIQDVRRKIAPSGEVVDDASPALRSIRERLRKQRTRLRGTLESYLRGRETAKYLQDQIVTDRNGRLVLIVKTEHRTGIPGIVHGSSGSGASLYLEPLSTVEINNDIVALEEQEAEEVRRILAALSAAFRERHGDLERTVETATELDITHAKACFAGMVRGVEPVLASNSALELLAARHPLLIPAVAARAMQDDEEGASGDRRDPVPVDIRLVPPATVLVVTGPNTGGKTVALKTAGLLALMAQSGLHIPAAPGSRFPVFRSVFADIGDEQSIAANLSTFSSHVRNIAGMDSALELPALLLLDEIGAGTDPVEGGALAMAVIDHFRRRGATVIATTHYDALKSFASTTEGVICAGFGFDPDTFAPTYRLVYGSPGRSLALEIAARLGLAESVIATARTHRSAREAQLAEHLARIEKDLKSLEDARVLLQHERQDVAILREELRARDEALRAREAAFKSRLDSQLERRLREARAEIDSIVEDLKKRTAALADAAARRAAAGEAALSTGELGTARANARDSLQVVADRFGSDTPTAMQPAGRLDGSTTGRTDCSPSPGDRVLVAGLGLEGIVRLIHDHDAEVNVRGKRLRVPFHDMRVLTRAGQQPAAIRVTVQVEPRDPQTGEALNVIGCTVDDALARAEKFLDEALLAERRTVRFVHGHGAGRLRRAIAEFLQSHPLVERFTAAPPSEGGGGVTVVDLKE